ncbi:MAG: VOC family protein [Actinomycetota bacterium]|nr:VOC family protein [Actinomycetota bacterium]
MASKVNSIVLNVSDLERASRFWQAALSYVPQESNPDFLNDPEGRGVPLHLDDSDRTHLDLRPIEAGGDVDAEVERLIALGASRVEWTYPDDADFVVLADTEGNLFCVVP